MTNLVLLCAPSEDGRSFEVILAKLPVTTLSDAEEQTHFELDILQRYTDIQGDMVEMRLVDVINSHIKRLASELERNLKQIRQSEQKKG